VDCVAALYWSAMGRNDRRDVHRQDGSRRLVESKLHTSSSQSPSYFRRFLTANIAGAWCVWDATVVHERGVRGGPGLLRLASGSAWWTALGRCYWSAMGRNDRRDVRRQDGSRRLLESKLHASSLQSPSFLPALLDREHRRCVVRWDATVVHERGVRGAPGLLRLASGSVWWTALGRRYWSAMGRNDS
jgi:hypothetical protein